MQESTIGMVPLPVRPKRYADEWQETFLGRLARANGLERPWRLDLERIRAWVGVAGADSPTGVAYGDAPLPGWAVLGRAAQIRYCPACLEEARYIRTRWRISALHICTRHHIRLKGGLVEPAITANYKRPGKFSTYAIQTEEIWDGAVCPLPSERAFADAIWAPFEQACEAGTNAADHLAWAIVAEKVLESVVLSVRGPLYPTRDCIRPLHRATWLAAAGQTISASYKGVIDFVQSLDLNVQRRAVARCFTSILKEEERQATIVSRLPLRALLDVVLASSPALHMNDGRGALSRECHPTDHLSFEKAVTTIGCSELSLALFIRKGCFSSVKHIREGRKRYTFIHQSEVEACRRWYKQCLRVDDVLSLLEIDKRGYWTLLDCGMLRPFRFGGGTCWHHFTDVASLLCKFDEVARPCQSSIGLFPLMGDWLYRRGRSRKAMVQVLREIQRGELPVYRRLDLGGLVAYYVDRGSIDRLSHVSGAVKYDAQCRPWLPAQLSLLEA